MEMFFIFSLHVVPCESGDFLCKSGYGCLNQSLICDNHPQCLNGSDEVACGMTSNFKNEPFNYCSTDIAISDLN